jgi:hypothetical protein
MMIVMARPRWRCARGIYASWSSPLRRVATTSPFASWRQNWLILRPAPAFGLKCGRDLAALAHLAFMNALPALRARAGHCRSSPRPAPQPSPKKIASAAAWETGAARFTSRKVLDVVGEPHLRLIAGKGHWHFVYHDIKAGIYDTRSIYAMRLSDLSFGRGAARLRRLRQHQVEVKLRTTAIAADLLAATAAQANDYSLVIACCNSTTSVEARSTATTVAWGQSTAARANGAS